MAYKNRIAATDDGSPGIGGTANAPQATDVVAAQLGAARRARRRRHVLTAAVAAVVFAALMVLLSGFSGSHYNSTAPSGTDRIDGLPTVKIAYLPITHALALFEQVEELNANPNRSYDIQLVKYGTWPELMDALNSGQVDGASVLAELGMRSNEQGIGVKAVALGHKDGNVIVARNGIGSTADLKGKTVAIPARQSSHYLLLVQALSQAGLSLSDVSITELAPTEMPSALASGQVDAYCVAEPFGAKAVEANIGHVIETSENLWSDSVCCMLVMNEKFLSQNKQLANRFVADYKAAGKQLDNTDEALSVAKKYLNQSDDVLTTSLQWISFDDLSIDRKDYEDLAARVKTAGLSQNPPSYEDFVENLGDN